MDASFLADELRGSTGAVIRDEYGVFLAASYSPMPHVVDAHLAEALA